MRSANWHQLSLLQGCVRVRVWWGGAAGEGESTVEQMKDNAGTMRQYRGKFCKVLSVSGSGSSIFLLWDYPWCLERLTWLSASSVCSVYSVGPAGLIGPSTEGLDPNSAWGPLHWEAMKWRLRMTATRRRLKQNRISQKVFTRSSRGIQIHRAQRLSRHVDVVDMVEDDGLFL